VSLWSRMGNAFRGGLLNCEIDEELESHIAKAIGAGRAPAEARQGLGSLLAAPQRKPRYQAAPVVRFVARRHLS
jgi:hypothetical protein